MLQKAEQPSAVKTHIVSSGMQIGVSEYLGTQYQGEVVLLALQTFGHLIRSVAIRKISFTEFADAIAKEYDGSNPKTGETIKVLREVAELNG